MIDRNELKGVIAKNGTSQSGVAKALGITPKTFYDKMKKGVIQIGKGNIERDDKKGGYNSEI